MKAPETIAPAQRPARTHGHDTSLASNRSHIIKKSQQSVADRTNTAKKAESQNLPSGIRNAEKSGIFTEIDRKTLPWLDEAVKSELTRITLATGEKFYLGSAIREKALTAAANALGEHYRKLTDNLFYSHLPEFVIKGYSPTVKQLVNSRTDAPTYYCANKGGQRVYFIRQPDIKDLPCIVRVAVCDKNKQEDVLSVLTTQNRKNISKFSKL